MIPTTSATYHERPYRAAWDAADRSLHVSGTIDERSADLFRDDLVAHVVACDQTMVVDLSDVDFFPSVAVAALVAGLNAGSLRQRELQVRTTMGSVPQRVLAICGLPYSTG